VRIEVDEFVPHESNTLRGFFKVYVLEAGIVIPGFSLHESGAGSRWVDFPSKPNKTGEYEKVVMPYDTRQAKKFSEQLLRLIDEYLQDRNGAGKKSPTPESEGQ